MERKTEIPYLDLQRLNESFEPELSKAILRTTNSGYYLLGNEMRHFETAFARYCGVRHCVGVGNGLDALTLILLAYRTLGYVEAGDEVIVPANTYIATILSVLRAGLCPVLCEPLNPLSTLDVQASERLITPRTKLLLPVHLYGKMADMEAVVSLAKKYRLLVVEDAAQAHGAAVANVRAGAWGDAAAFSFYPAKNLGALGDGGAVTTNDIALSETVRALANYGSVEKHNHLYRFGVNSRLDELQAAVLGVKLPRLDADNERRRNVARRYLAEIAWEKPVIYPSTTVVDASHVFHVFAVFTPYRNELLTFLATQGVHAQVHYPVPPHRQKALQGLFETLSLPVTEKLHEYELSLPISPVLNDEEVTQVINAVNAWKKYARR